MQSIYHPLLENNTRYRFKWKCNRQLCSVSSKPVLLILTWNFLISFAVALFTSPDFYSLITSYSSANLIKVLTFGLSGFLLLFYPLATCLVDRKWGRYKTIVNSLYCLLCTATVMCALGGALIAILIKNAGSQTLYLGLGVPILVAFLLSLFSLITFKANAFQFGADQLIDCSSDHYSIYVYWYVWSSYAGTALQQIVSSLVSNITAKTASESTTLFILIPVFAILILGVTLVIQCCNHHWFINDVIDFNPCQLIYRVTSFAIKHKHPLQRSAFTYCDDEIPTRIDFGKERYGGPFTTEQVEDVKTFLNILRVLLALGPIFAVDIAASNQLPTVAYHLASDFGTALLQPLQETCAKTYPTILALNGSITPLIITFIIPIYTHLLRPFIKNHIPMTFKRIGLGMVVLTLSLISTLLVDTVGHIHSSSTMCFLGNGHHFNHTCDLVELPSISPLYIIIPYTLNAFAYVFLYTGVYEFILSQSPHAMKGLVIGIFFAIKGVFQLLAVLTVYLPFINWSSDSSFPSCGFVYYFINVVIALIGIAVYTWAAVKYPYRRYDILPYDQRFVEEIYSRRIDDDVDDLLYRVKENDVWVRRESTCDNPPSTSQATNTHKQENAIGNSRRAKVELPDHISSRNKSKSN